MPDTQPLTDSFPYLTKRYIHVFDNRNIVVGGPTAIFYITETGDFYVTENGVDSYVTEAGTQPGTNSPGDLYRLI